MRNLLIRAGAGLLAGTICATAIADPTADIVGDYQLVSSKTVPDSKWGYAKARVAIRSLGNNYLSIVIACGWKDIPKSSCSDRFYARQREDGIYIQDVNTFGFRMYFEPASRRLTFISRGLDKVGSVRHEVYAPTTAPITDPDLSRRMRREQRYVDEDIQKNISRKLGRETFTENRIEFQAPATKGVWRAGPTAH